ncbi:LuxR C-terminal-related transcriptional regulator [Nocardia sp. R7R-8]|uniref:LuxR C-terminal-related transcriptional regulator n=1 Tax=Nocardia sp. R7R-8 TaxID=3459304 RepID=UPI00403DAB43
MAYQYSADMLSRRQLRGILETLESCGSSSSLAEYKKTLVTRVRELFDVRDVTFFCGPTYAALFSDPDPILTGDIVPLLEEYRSRWKDKDIFTSPEARRTLSREGFVTLDQLRWLPMEQRSYVEGYLLPHRMGKASALHLKLADGEALVGMFDTDRGWDRSDLVAVRTLARHLNIYSRQISISSEEGSDLLDELTPRQMEVARLVGDGLSNAEIAHVLCVSEAAVKKHLSRIFVTARCPNRAALTAAVLRRDQVRGGFAHPVGH